jgi:hypothetical protein
VTSEDLRGELDREPFVPLRIHMVSGKTLDVPRHSAAMILRNALMVLEPLTPGIEGRYDLVALRNIERVEQIEDRPPRSDADDEGRDQQ